ncbi:MAG: hypothetical protein HEQ32_01780 [Vampirovibrio sp.]
MKKQQNQQNNEQAQKNPSFVVPPFMWLSLGAVLISVGVGLGLFFKEPIAEAYERTTQMFASTPLSAEELAHQRLVKKCNDDAIFLRTHPDLYEDNRIKNCTVTEHTKTGEEKRYSLVAQWDVAYGKKPPTPTPTLKVEVTPTGGKP